MPVIHTLAPFTTRPVTPADGPRLRTIYRSTRNDELAATGWPSEVIEAFCNQQYGLQQVHYRRVHPGADHQAILDGDGRVIGQVMIQRGALAHTVVDIALFPQHRGRGRGTRVLEAAIATADRQGLPVQLTVDRHNPAQALYRRLGFETISATELHLHMRRDATRKEPE